MNQLIFPLALITALFSDSASGATLKAEEILSNYIDARGGMENIETVQSARMTGSMTIGGGGHGHGNMGDLPVVYEYLLPKKSVRMEFEMQGRSMIRAYDGSDGWYVMPFAGNTDPQPMNADDEDAMQRQADLFGPLINPDQKGFSIEYLGLEEVEGTQAHKLKATNASGDNFYYYLDTDYFLVFRSEGHAMIQGRKVKAVSSFGDYKDINGILFPHSVSVELPTRSQTLTYDSIELNPEIAENRFIMPEAG